MGNLKLAFRTLARTPFVTAVAVLSLALGIGANAAIYSLFDQMLLRALPVQAPDRLVNLTAPGPKPGSNSCSNAGGCDEVFSYAMFRDLQHADMPFSGIAAHRVFDANLAYRGQQTLNGQGMLVSGSYFPVLGVRPALGRLLGPEDDRVIGESHVVVLSHDYWQTRFGLNLNVLNEPITINGQSMTIVGVAAPGFDGTTLGVKPRVFVPITLRGQMQPGFKGFDERQSYWAYLFARLKPGITVEQARAAANVPYHAIVTQIEAPLQKGMSDKTKVQFKAKTMGVVRGAQGQSSARPEAKAPLMLLLGVTAFVLLIACANIANLLLARAAARANEMAVRVSIGASRWQVMGQLLTESLLLAALGAVAGLVVARWTLDLIQSLLPSDSTDMLNYGIDGSVLLFTAALALGTGMLFGLFPAIHSSRPDLIPLLKGQAGQPGGARAAARFRTGLATAQIALSMALLVGAGLFTRSLMNVSRVDLGLKVDNLVTFGIAPELNAYTPERSRALFERLEDRLKATPGVTSVAMSLVPALAGSNWGTDVAVEGFKKDPDTDDGARYNEVNAGYFRAMGMPLIAGREFTRADRLGGAKVAIVNQQFAKKFHLGHDVIGKHMSSDDNDSKLDTEIVGFVQDAKYSEVKGEIPPIFFMPIQQDESIGYANFYVRTSLDEGAILPVIPKVMGELDPNLPVVNLKTMTQQVRENVFLDRFISVLAASFACLATLLAAVGLYGVLAYTVAQRTREIGLRMALGAEPGRVRAMVLRQVAIMTLIGGTVGLLASIWLGNLAGSLLFELKGYDPAVLVTSAVLLTLVALGAGFVPAHRASRVEPMHALRYE
jgi:putative ABC transport system permease protein